MACSRLFDSARPEAGFWGWFRVSGLGLKVKGGGPIFWGIFFFGTFSLFFLGKQHVPYILDGFRAISIGFPKKTFIPFFFLKRTKRRKEGRKQGNKEGGKKEGRKQGSRNEGRKESRENGTT